VALDPSVCLPPEAGGGDAACTPTPPTSQPQVLAGEVSRVRSDCGVCGQPPPFVRPVPASTKILLIIELPLRNPEQLLYCSGQLSTPDGSFYMQYLTPDQFTALYGATACDVQALTSWVEGHGLSVTSTFSDGSLGVAGSAAAIGAALHLQLGIYLRPDGTQFFAPDRDPTLESALPVQDVIGLDSCLVAMPVSSTSR
jgi:subtilase family serine protease